MTQLTLAVLVLARHKTTSPREHRTVLATAFQVVDAAELGIAAVEEVEWLIGVAVVV